MVAFPWKGLKGKRASDRPKAQPPRARRDRALESAIRNCKITLRFQPQIDPASGRIEGVEALARWAGAASPEILFERAAAAGLSERLSRTVQRQALRCVAAWPPALADIGVSINITAEDLDRDGYEDWLLAEIVAAGLRPERLTVEIVENMLVADRPAAAERLMRLRAAGVRIAVDDFGTGYASLAYLTSLPLDTLKIDRGLIIDIVGGSRDRIVVKAMIHLARDLGLKVVVEGVESSAQLALLAEWGCDLYQGFLGAGALDEDELIRFATTSLAAAA